MHGNNGSIRGRFPSWGQIDRDYVVCLPPKTSISGLQSGNLRVLGKDVIPSPEFVEDFLATQDTTNSSIGRISSTLEPTYDQGHAIHNARSTVQQALEL